MNIFIKTKCHARLVSNPNKQCSRKQNDHCNFCNIHEKIWRVKGLSTILTDKKTITKYAFRISPKSYKVSNIKKLQKLLRGFITRRSIILRGICLYSRHKCNNVVDCMELQNINTITNNNFISYMDVSGLYWGFHIKTFHNLLKYNTKNPYNCKEIPDDVKINFKNLKFIPEDDKKKLNKSDQLQQKCVDIFQKIDNLNNYTKCSWFLNLNLVELKSLYYFIFDMWNYRLNLPPDDKKKYISDGKLFKVPYKIIKTYTNYYKISNIILGIFDRLVSEGQTESDKATAANWILSSLTLVNLDARLAFPWLYQAAYPH